MLGYNIYTNTLVSFEDYYDEFVPIIVRYDAFLGTDNLEIQVDTTTTTHTTALDYELGTLGQIWLGGSAGGGSHYLNFKMRNLTINRRWVE
jgi:hypothetical protein